MRGGALALVTALCAARSQVPAALQPEEASVELREPAGASALWQPSGERPRLRHLFWAHVPKTSTTFGSTVFSYACGPDADDFAAVKTTRPPFLVGQGDCNGGASSLQMGLQREMQRQHPRNWATWFHMPLPQVAVPGTGPSPDVGAVMLFRKPHDRLRAAMAHLASPREEDRRCCGGIELQKLGFYGGDWGWSSKNRALAWLAAHGVKLTAQAERDLRGHLLHWMEIPANAENYTVADPMLESNFTRQQRYLQLLASTHSLLGCQTKYVLGYGCHESHALTPAEVSRAVSFVETPAAFIGLMERRVGGHFSSWRLSAELTVGVLRA